MGGVGGGILHQRDRLLGSLESQCLMLRFLYVALSNVVPRNIYACILIKLTKSKACGEDVDECIVNGLHRQCLVSILLICTCVSILKGTLQDG